MVQDTLKSVPIIIPYAVSKHNQKLCKVVRKYWEVDWEKKPKGPARRGLSGPAPVQAWEGGDPRRGSRQVALSGPAQVSTCQVGSPADSGGGARLSPEKAGGKSAGGCAPWTPGFYSRSFPLAEFCVGCVRYGLGAVTSGMLRPIWDAFSRKNMLKKNFAKESPQIRARTWAP